ncbi:MAG: glycosyltransferase, partial [Acidimicrobiales bacterium]
MTVVVPVLNEEKDIAGCVEAIEACLDAVAAQTYERIVEVLVVDGGSTDLTRSIVESRLGVRLL